MNSDSVMEGCSSLIVSGVVAQHTYTMDDCSRSMNGSWPGDTPLKDILGQQHLNNSGNVSLQLIYR